MFRFDLFTLVAGLGIASAQAQTPPLPQTQPTIVRNFIHGILTCAVVGCL